MTLAKDDFMKLLELQALDKDLDAQSQGIAKIPEDIAAIKDEIEQDKARLQGLHDKAKEVQVRRKEKENEMASKEEAIRKHQGELNQVKTNEAFKALQKEIDGAKASVGELETEILNLMDEGDSVITEEKALKVELQAFEDECNKRIQALEARKSELEKKKGETDAKRKALEGSVTAELFTLYEKTRERRGGIGLSRLEDDGSCAVCRMKQTPQIIIDVKKCTKISTCGSCQRILHNLSVSPAETA